MDVPENNTVETALKTTPQKRAEPFNILLITESLSDDKEANPRGFKITTLEAASLPLSLPDLDAATINGNYALGADLPATYPALGIEEFDDETSVRRTNFVVVKEGNEESEKTKALVEAIKSDAVKNYIEEHYKGSVIPSFIDPQ